MARFVCELQTTQRTEIGYCNNSTSVDAGASLGASLRELASEAAAVCVHS